MHGSEAQAADAQEAGDVGGAQGHDAQAVAYHQEASLTVSAADRAAQLLLLPLQLLQQQLPLLFRVVDLRGDARGAGGRKPLPFALNQGRRRLADGLLALADALIELAGARLDLLLERRNGAHHQRDLPDRQQHQTQRARSTQQHGPSPGFGSAKWCIGTGFGKPGFRGGHAHHRYPQQWQGG